MSLTRFISLTTLVIRALVPKPRDVRLMSRAQKAGIFDRQYYRTQIAGLHRFWRMLPARHYLLRGEAMGLLPAADFCPTTYLKLNPDVATAGLSPLRHYVDLGLKEGRISQTIPVVALPKLPNKIMRFDPKRPKAPFAIHLHLYYPELWAEFEERFQSVDVDFDLYVTLTWRGEETNWLADQIREAFPNAFVVPMGNKGRDILPFVKLVNAGAFDGYDAVCKLHGKKSPHREDGEVWRDQLVSGIVPTNGLSRRLGHFLSDPDAAFWVADGQNYPVAKWWGSNRDTADALLRRVELDQMRDNYDFPAGSMYWIKPLMIGMIRALNLTDDVFEPEEGQIDGTLAHAFERAIGAFACAAGQRITQTHCLRPQVAPAPKRPTFVSAFYLPQFHPIAENDAWWGTGYTEWTAVTQTGSAFPGHLQPARPADLGYYDLRLTDVMGQQAAMAEGAGIDAFCVYHYWFGGQRLLETPLDNLMKRADVSFPFYLCWANESWRRNWDGLSGEVLAPQDYAPGFEAKLVASTLPYMSDPRYQRPDGRRPRFVIYRPEDLPAPEQNIARMRRAWRDQGIGEVEIGAVSFHISGSSEVSEGLFDFWIEMPPHGIVDPKCYLFGGADGDQMKGAGPAPGFKGLIYDYRAVARHSVDPKYRRKLPRNTIPGIMPSWDNSARRKMQAHIAKGATPATFRAWLKDLQAGPLRDGYRGELFINAWNEWGEKAMLEPTQTFGHLYLDVLAEALTTTEHKRMVQNG